MSGSESGESGESGSNDHVAATDSHMDVDENDGETRQDTPEFAAEYSADGMSENAEDEGLFGSEDEQEASPKKVDRQLDDEDLDSGDDEDGDDRGTRVTNGDAEEQADEDDGDPAGSTVMDAAIAPHGVPRGSDGEIYVLKFPPFLGVAHEAHSTHQALPKTDHHQGESAPSADFSRHAVANSSLRWRHAHEDFSRLESNSRIIRWSDGDLSLQFGGNPTDQFELPAKTLSLPKVQTNKMTPSSRLRAVGKNGTVAYSSHQETPTFLVSTHERPALLQMTNRVTTSLSVLPSSTNIHDEALSRLQSSLAAATRGKRTTLDGSMSIISITEDPELAKRKAEQAEKDQLRIQKKIQATQMREAERASRTLSKHGLGKSGGGGLDVGDLEDDDERPTPLARRRGAAPTPRKKAPRARDRDSDTDEGAPRGRTREDEYDKTDDFLADSDEEEVDGEGEEEEDDDEAEAVADEEGGSQKRGKVTGDGAEAAARGKRRRVVDDDDDDDE
ncbi:MAG: hypothetical protein M1832_004836 [Thelocarpon impressellum]|nr:MAG: hypothetical protein M1832_004836 [Thelocarpon impressellum]